MNYSLLKVINNDKRKSENLDGLWKFCFDEKKIGIQSGYPKQLKNPIQVPVPCSFNDLFTDADSRDYCGDFWYQKTVYIENENERFDYFLRFGAVTHRCEVYLNGQKIGFHEGGFLPFEINVTNDILYDCDNIITVKGNNELNESTLPCGAVKELMNGKKIATPYFDFFNYSGITRSVALLKKPKARLEDFDISYTIQDEYAEVKYHCYCNKECEIQVCLKDQNGEIAAQENAAEGILKVEKPTLWNVCNPYLYTIEFKVFKDQKYTDHYQSEIGIREVKIDGTKILINGEPVYLKGFGKHEDFYLYGRTSTLPIIKRDFECMKWTNANCFRTSHYPYSEEWYEFADREGFLIIDEVPAVGMMRSTKNYVDAGKGNYTSFFETETVPMLLSNHKAQVLQMVQRDKNHPSVIAFSLFNEAETISEYGYRYFKDVFDTCKSADPQKRPCTGAFEKNSKPELCKVYPLCDFICLNRYYGWYISGGSEREDAWEMMKIELDKWKNKQLNKPFVISEMGCDTLAQLHKLPSIMWSQEYQNEYYLNNFRIMDDYHFISGELVWNFADFMTSQGIFRVDGNNKGIFTRDRQPKDIAFLLKKRWKEK